MGDSLLEVYYAVLSDHDMLETFLKWAKKEKLLPKKRWFRKRNSDEEIEIMVSAVKKFIQTDIPSTDLKDELELYS